MRLFPIAGLILSAALLSGCGSDSPSAPTGPVDAQITLAPGQTVAVDAAAIAIRFQGVMGDSRCPGDAICIQGGDALVRVDVLTAGGGGAATFDLHTGSMQPVTYQDLTIALETLAPYPFGSLPPIGPGDYRATLRVTR
jgi:hypothetical protein